MLKWGAFMAEVRDLKSVKDSIKPDIKNILDRELYSYKGQGKDNIYSGVGKILKEKYSFTEKQKWELIQIRMELQKLRENIKNRK